MTATAPTRPNILWLMSEDCPPKNAAYGDALARTPTIDRLAREGTVFENAFSVAPVCAPSRFALLTGIYPTSAGPAHNMRAAAHAANDLRTYPQEIRAAGYYCANNAKTDYNCDVDPARIWDDSSASAHWRNRPAGAPFLAVFNPVATHESAVFFEAITDVLPEQVRVPAYLPDIPEVRKDMARYYTAIAKMDRALAERLDELEQDGLLEDTIIIYSSDHGGVSPRSKRFCYDEGLQVPLIIRVPERWKAEFPWAAESRVRPAISQIDLAPTLIAIAGGNIPPQMQGRPIAAPPRGGEPRYAFSARDRMDERYDMIRTVRDERYRYIRNYAPHRIYGQHSAFAWMAAAYQGWEREHLAGSLSEVQDAFWRTKAAEELFDTHIDPDETVNLIDDPQLARVAQRLRAALDRHILDTNDNGFLPEGSAVEGYHPSRQPHSYPLQHIMHLAELAIARSTHHVHIFAETLASPDETARFWAAQGCLMLGAGAHPARPELLRTLTDPSLPVRIVAAEALTHVGHGNEAVAALRQLLRERSDAPVLLQALNALTYIGDIAAPAEAELLSMVDHRDEYVRGAARYLKLKLGGTYTPESVVFDIESRMAKQP